MRLLRVQTGEEFEAEIRRVKVGELSEIDASGRFGFEWKRERGNEVFKISPFDDDEILGLISMVEFPGEERVHIRLIENSIENTGSSKKVDWIAGCLFAYAVQFSVDLGYDGFVSLIPKTELIPLYKNKYGFQMAGRNMALFGKPAFYLMNKYLQ